MGNNCSSSALTNCALSDEALGYLPLTAQMEHGNLAIAYFPGHISDPIITEKIVLACNTSWKQLLNGDSEPLRRRKAADTNSSPITAFYDVFYQHLFEKAPSTRQFFAHGGIQKRAQSLIQMISTGLNMIDKDEAKIKKNLSFIASSHGKMGIGPKDYSPVVTALFFTLKELLAELWTPEVLEAWTVAYSYIVNIMVPVAADSVREYNKKKEAELKTIDPTSPRNENEGENSPDNQIPVYNPEDQNLLSNRAEPESVGDSEPIGANGLFADNVAIRSSRFAVTQNSEFITAQAATQD